MWRGLLKLKFSFHRNISRKGLVKFVKKKFPKKMREIEDLERSVSVRKTTELKVKSTLCFAMISTALSMYFRRITLQPRTSCPCKETRTPSLTRPTVVSTSWRRKWGRGRRRLRGRERNTILNLTQLLICRALCRKWKRTHKRKLLRGTNQVKKKRLI